MNGWLLIRLGGIALGIITLLGFASGYMNVEFKPYVQEVLDSLQYFADFIIQPELIERGLDYLRQHFAWVPKPEPHWKPIYTLSALLMLTVAQGSRTLWFRLPSAIVCSVVPAVFVGTMPLNSAAMIFWPIAGWFVYQSLAFIFPSDPEADRQNAMKMQVSATVHAVLGVGMTLGFSVIAVLAGYLLTSFSATVIAYLIAGIFAVSAFIDVWIALGWRSGLVEGMKSAYFLTLGYFFGSLNGGYFVLLAGFVSLWGALLLFGGLQRKGSIVRRLQRGSTLGGINILGTLGSALALGYLFAA